MGENTRCESEGRSQEGRGSEKFDVSRNVVPAAVRETKVVDEWREAARSANTRIAYAKAWGRFAEYCRGRRVAPEDARSDDIMEFFVRLATEPAERTGRTLSIGTLRIYRSALNQRFGDIRQQSPAAGREVSDLLAGIARMRGEAPRRVKALREYEIASMLEVCPNGRFGCRDAAMLALGFAAALRRSELCGLLVTDINVLGYDKMIVSIRRSKTDQVGRGQRIAVLEGSKIKPVSRVREWLEVAGIQDGHLFQTFRSGGRPSGRGLSHSEVPRLVKRYAAKVGLDPASYSGHSLRAGFVTSAATHGARLDKIMEVTRHRNPATVIQYIRDADVFDQHAGAKFM